MELAITVFLVTLAVVGGILSPVIFVAVVGTIGNAFKAASERIILASKEADKAPPFDDVEANLNPMTKVLTVRFHKNGKMIWQGSATRNEQEAADTITFNGGNRG